MGKHDDNQFSGPYSGDGAKGVSDHSRRLAVANMQAQDYLNAGRQSKRRFSLFPIAKLLIMLVISAISFTYGLPSLTKKVVAMKKNFMMKMSDPVAAQKLILQQQGKSTEEIKQAATELTKNLEAEGVTTSLIPDEEMPHEADAPVPATDDEVNIVAKGDGKRILYVATAGAAGNCQIHLESAPRGARVQLNDKFVGVTPVNVRGECDKPSKLTFDLDNHLPASRTLAFTKKPSDLFVQLHPIPKPKANGKPSGKPKGMIETMQESLGNALSVE